MPDYQKQDRSGIFDDDRLYRPEDEDMRVFGTREKLAQWRHRNKGPAWTKIGRQVAYFGSDLNAYLSAQRTDPNGEAA